MHYLPHSLCTFLLILCLSMTTLSLNAISKERDVITFDILESYPFAYKNDDGKSVGTFWEYVDSIAKTSGLNISKRITPKARVIDNLKSGAADAAIIFKSDKLNDHVEYIAKVRTIPIIVATQKGIHIEQYDDLKQFDSVGIFRSSSISSMFDKDESINKQLIPNYVSLVKMLGANRLKVITGNGAIITALIDQLCLQDTIDASPLIMGNREQWLVMSKKSAHLIQGKPLKKTILALKAEGRLDGIFNAHLSQNQQDCSQK